MIPVPEPTTAAGHIELRPVGLPESDQAYRGYIVASLSLALLVGFVLGIHVPVSRLLGSGGPERTLDLIQAHGQVQILGFAGLYVMGMSLRLAPRFAGGKVAFGSLITPILWLVVTSLLLRAVLMPLLDGDAHNAVLLTTAFGLLIAAGAFLFITFATVAVASTRSDASTHAFVFGAALLFIAMTVAALGDILALNEGARTLPYLTDNSVLQLELLGFLLCFILGVASRSLPSMVGRQRPERAARRCSFALAATVLLLVGCLLYLEYVSYSELPVALVGLAVGVSGLIMLQIVWLVGVLRPAANRIRPSSRPHLWLLRSAFVWLAIAGVISLYVGASALWRGELPAQLDFDAIRHALTVGLVTQMIVGMSLMILPEFAVERQNPNHQRLLAIFLVVTLNLGALLRVVPSLVGDSWSNDNRNLSMAIAGGCAEAAMIVFAAALFRLLRFSDKPSKSARPA